MALSVGGELNSSLFFGSKASYIAGGRRQRAGGRRKILARTEF
jgi:hypothetical protein